jgi:hypothetical protein
MKNGCKNNQLSKKTETTGPVPILHREEILSAANPAIKKAAPLLAELLSLWAEIKRLFHMFNLSLEERPSVICSGFNPDWYGISRGAKDTT